MSVLAGITMFLVFLLNLWVYDAYKIEICLEIFISQTHSLSNIYNQEKLDQPKLKFIISPWYVDSMIDLTNVQIQGNKK